MPDLTEQQLHAIAANGAKDREIEATLGRKMTTALHSGGVTPCP